MGSDVTEGQQNGRARFRVRRGEVRTAVLAILAEKPGYGYEVIQALDDKSRGTWRPSPGSVYPTLHVLEEEGLVRSQERDGKRVYEVTKAGREEAARRLEEAGRPPWDTGGPDIRGHFRAVGLAYQQVLAAGSHEQIERALEILKDARRELYLLLADD